MHWCRVSWTGQLSCSRSGWFGALSGTAGGPGMWIWCPAGVRPACGQNQGVLCGCLQLGSWVGGVWLLATKVVVCWHAEVQNLGDALSRGRFGASWGHAKGSDH